MSTGGNIANTMSAASLVLAVLAALYGLWLPHVSETLDLVPETDKANRGPQKKKVKLTIWTKSLPLFAASLAASVILLPRGILIVSEVWCHHKNWYYDDVKALYALTLILLIFLTVATGRQLFGVICKGVALTK